MLFNSFVFLFGFLPIALLVFYSFGRWRQDVAKYALTLLSLGFYAWWRPVYLPILLFSIVFNFGIGAVIQRAVLADRANQARGWLIFGILVDVSLLGWFKYANFVVENLNALGADITLNRIILPLAISFFTFQKIAYLVDSAEGKAKNMTFRDFALFASFFPPLLAGPIVHYSEVVPQLARRRFGRLNWSEILIGLVIFAIGLFKKTVIADSLVVYVDPLFTAAAKGQHLGLMGGWLAGVTYTFQLYFDFSGYSDMAIGLGRMFGIRLPLNFHSPLRARDLIEYWRRWHMTLQRFIVAYVYTPIALPLNRLSAALGWSGWSAFSLGELIPVLVSFVIIGIWHGAGWTFVLFGFLHAGYVGGNQVWRERERRLARARRRAGKPQAEPGPVRIAACHALTLVLIMIANVLFRAKSVAAAVSIWTDMAGLGARAPAGGAHPLDGGLLALILLSALIAFAMPNTQQIMRRFGPALNWEEWRGVAPALFRWTWRPSIGGLVFAGVALCLGVIFIQRGQAVFIYFNF
jgi:D-alanyl-lipoteichoic acid acyltransferase DltB (MBOAT superfamily)